MKDRKRGADVQPFFNRLRRYADVGEELESMFDAVGDGHTDFARNTTIWPAGAAPDHALIIERGWAFHYKDLPGGERQICQILVPGDVIDGAAILPGGRTTTAVATVEPVRVQRLHADRLLRRLSEHPRIAAAFWWTVVQTDNIFREHVTRVGRQSAAEAMAHLLLEMVTRCEMAGVGDRSDENGVQVPLTQSHIADYLGITAVHVSRTMTLLRQAKLLEFERRILRILRWDALTEFAAFDPTYLTVGCAPADE